MSKTLRLTMEQSALEKGFATILHDWQAPPSGDAPPNDTSSPTPEEAKVEIRVANRIFPDRSVEVDARFQSVTRRGFGAPLEQLDFRGAHEAARKHINDWVEQQTKSRIVDLLPPRSIDGETRMVLANAIYLAAPWADPFLESATAPAAFFVDGKTQAQVPTMRRTSFLPHAKLDGLAIVELPLRGGRFAFDVILPDARDGLPAAERILSTATWKRWIDALAPKRVSLALPKFRVEPGQPLTLKESLEKMGMHLAFDRAKADFTGIANPPSPADRLVIGEVFHKAFVDVNEAGVEAAAATAVVMPRAGSAPPKDEPIAFTVDHPFLFVIRDVKTNMVVFLGRVTDPKAPAN
jgi:serpin B